MVSCDQIVTSVVYIGFIGRLSSYNILIYKISSLSLFRHRTDDLYVANVALSQLSYGPINYSRLSGTPKAMQ